MEFVKFPIFASQPIKQISGQYQLRNSGYNGILFRFSSIFAPSKLLEWLRFAKSASSQIMAHIRVLEDSNQLCLETAGGFI